MGGAETGGNAAPEEEFGYDGSVGGEKMSVAVCLGLRVRGREREEETY